MEQDQALKPLHRSPQSKGMGVGQNQDRKLCQPITCLTQRKRQKRWENRCKQAKPPNARFLGWFQSNSSVFWTVVSHWLNAPTVQGRARWNRAMECSDFRLTTN